VQQAGNRDIVNRDTDLMAAASADIHWLMQTTAVPENSFLTKVVLTPLFDCLSALMIVGSVALMGVETEYLSTHSQISPAFVTLWSILNLWFIVELFLRINAMGRSFFYGPDWKQNYVDLVLAGLSLVEFFVAIRVGLDVRVGYIRSLRVLRACRIARLFRIIQYFKTFSKMAMLIVAGINTLWGLIILLFLTIYIFAVVFTMAAIDQLRSGDALDDETASVIKEYYGSMLASTYTLYLAMTNGMSWHLAADALKHISIVWWLCFLAYITFGLFCVLNVVTSVFVESTIEATRRDRDLLMQDYTERTDAIMRHMRTVFQCADTDGSGFITADELEHFLEHDEKLILYLNAMDISTRELTSWLKMMDFDDDQQISVEEFCEGCLKLKGEAKSFDVHNVLMEVRKCLQGVRMLLEANGTKVRRSISTK